jgi:[acyl-carrier-protein] S-malonyltransferase
VTESDPRILYVFPGQGCQYRGMGSDLLKAFDGASEIFSRASDVVGYDMATLCLEDPDSELDLTRFTQPALVTHQLACRAAFNECLGDTNVVPAISGGHSLGEYSALVVAGALSTEDAVALVKRRGELMSEYGEGSMLATTLDLATARALADQYFCGIGGCNLPEQTVIAGRDADLDALEAGIGERFPRKRAQRLRTGGAFHTYLMVEAARRFREVLDAVEFKPLETATLSNYTGGLHEPEPQSIRSRLFFQLFNPVLWFACMETAFAGGVDAIVEFGGGLGTGETPAEKRPNLAGMVKKAQRACGNDATYHAAINVDGIRAAAEALG